eukprot:scaffold34967_cov58-Attheya_sp.AAC.1
MSDHYLLHHWTLEGCWRKHTSPILDQATWELLQDAYRHAVQPEHNSTIALDPKSGFLVPYEVRMIPGKGRGIFATEKIKSGEGVIIWKTIQVAKFTDKLSWQRFLSSIPYEIACDACQWSYTYRVKHEKQNSLFLDLDDGALLNEASANEEINVEETREGSYVPLRDIEAGEEIIITYSGLSDNIDWYKHIKQQVWQPHLLDYDNMKYPTKEEETVGHDWKMLLVLVFSFMIICFFWKKSRYRHVCAARCRKKAQH